MKTFEPKFYGRLLLALTCLAVTGCDNAAETKEAAVKPTTKIAEIYYRYAVELAANAEPSYEAQLAEPAITKGAQCVQNEIVSKGLGIYRQTKLRSLFLDHIFPNELSTYTSFTDDARVQAGAEARLKKLGFESYDAAIKSNNMITRALLTEYTYYARFRAAHDIASGIKPENLVLSQCLGVE